MNYINEFLKKMQKSYKRFAKRNFTTNNLILLVKLSCLLGITAVILVFATRFIYHQFMAAFNSHPYISFFVVTAVLIIIGNALEKRPETNVPVRMSKSARRQTYINLRTLIYYALCEVHGVIGIPSPKSPEAIETSNKISVADNIVFFHYIVTKGTTEIDEDVVHELIERTVNRLAKSKKYVSVGCGKDLIINGNCYDPILIHDVSATRNYVEITAVVNSATYINYLNYDKATSLDNGIDEDLECDDDF